MYVIEIKRYFVKLEAFNVQGNLFVSMYHIILQI